MHNTSQSGIGRVATYTVTSSFTRVVSPIALAAVGLFVFLSLTLSLLIAPPTSAAIPTLMHFQGRLTDTTGNIKPNGTYNMRLRVYDAASGGTLKYAEDRLVSAGKGATLTNGLFAIKIGEGTPTTGTFDASLFTSPSLYLEVELPSPSTATSSGTPTWSEGPMTPRNQMATSAYAFNAALLDGKSSSEFAAASGSTNYIQNRTTQQADASFNISGSGTVGGALTVSGQTNLGHTYVNNQINLDPSSASNAIAFNWAGKANASYYYYNGASQGTPLMMLNGTSGNMGIGIGNVNPDTKLDVGGAISRSENSIRTYTNVYSYNQNVSTVTGAYILTLPKGWSNTMLNMRIVGFSHNNPGGADWEVKLSGYNYGAGYWHNPSSEISGNAPFSRVRFGYDGSKAVIILGDATTQWGYPKIVLQELVAGYANIDGWGTGWSGNITTSETGISAIGEPAPKIVCYANGNCAGSYIQNSTSPQTANFNIIGDGTIRGSLTLGGVTRNRVFNNVLSAAPGWVKVGTLSLPQGGNDASISFYGGNGYNAGNQQNASVNLHIRTSNAVDVDANGFGASASASRFEQNADFIKQIKLVGNAAGGAASAYDVYVYSATYIGQTFYKIDSGLWGSWSESMTNTTDPGVNSATVYNVPFEFIAQNTLYVGNDKVGIGTYGPTAKIDVVHSSNTVYGMRISNGGGSATGVLINGGTTSGSTASLLRVADYTNTTPFFTVSNGASYFQNSFLGVGTASPQYPLDVQGSVRFTGIANIESGLRVGSSTTDGTASLLVLDSYNGASDPSGAETGSMYYNSTMKANRCKGETSWYTCGDGKVASVALWSDAPGLANDTWTAWSFAHESLDNDSMHDTTTGNNQKVTFNTPGCYQVNGEFQTINHPAGYRELALMMNGDRITGHMQAHSVVAPVNGNNTSMTISTLACVSAGDYMQLYVYQNSGAVLQSDGRMQVYRVSGVGKP